MTLRIGRPDVFEASDKDVMVARKVMRLGGDLSDVHEALGWKCAKQTTRVRLKRRGLVVPSRRVKRAHDGDDTYLKPSDEPKDGE